MVTSPGSTVPAPKAITAIAPSANPSTPSSGGYKTYAKGIEMGMEKGFKAAGLGPQTKNYAFSRHPREAPLSTFEFVNEPVKPFAQCLRPQPGKNIWMMGGGEIIASFLDQGEIDEFRIHVIPILIGEGIPLIQPRRRSSFALTKAGPSQAPIT